MNGFVYKWTNTLTGKWYIGSHKGTPDDGYRHTSELLTLAEEKYGQENFIREILYVGRAFREEEARLLNETNAAGDRNSYNRTNIVGPNCLSEDTRKKISEANIGKKHTAETKQKMSEKRKGRKTWNKGLKTGPRPLEVGKKISKTKTGIATVKRHTEETKEKMRISQRERRRREKS